jgi:sortase (surface protein transpeptidase)
VQRAGIMMMAAGLAAVALGLGGWAMASGPWGHAQADLPAEVPVPRGPAATRPPPSTAPEVARPVRLVIPAIGVRTGLIRLGLSSAGALQVPVSSQVAGWFAGSPRPGAVGASIIAGHIDSRLGPGVFFRLGKLRRGQHVYVVRADRTVATFTITSVRTYAKSAFPDSLVYGAVPDAELRLITCGGLFDYATGSYLSNVVVYATLDR